MTSQSNTEPTRFVEAGGTRFAYRRFGDPIGTPIVLLQHFMGNLDNYDPAITEALAMGRDAPLFRKVYTPQDLMWLPIFFSPSDAFSGRPRVGSGCTGQLRLPQANPPRGACGQRQRRHRRPHGQLVHPPAEPAKRRADPLSGLEPRIAVSVHRTVQPVRDRLPRSLGARNSRMV